MILRGKIIFDTYCSAKNAVNNLMNPLYRKPKSGENISGVLLQVRMTLYKDHMKSLQREKLMRESRNLAELKGKSNAADREAWIVQYVSNMILPRRIIDSFCSVTTTFVAFVAARLAFSTSLVQKSTMYWYTSVGIRRDQSYSPIGSGRYSPPIAKKLSCKSDADHVSSWLAFY
jgi:hypothetical protein